MLALIVHSSVSFPPKGTSVIVLDTVSAPFENAYLRATRSSSTADAAKWASTRKFAVMSELINKLGKLAAVHNVAVLLTCQTSTKLRQGAPAILLPAISGHEWDAGISTQLCMFMDWLPKRPHAIQRKETTGQVDRVRYLGVVKLSGAGTEALDGSVGAVFPFKIQKVCNSNGVLRCVSRMSSSPRKH